MVNNKHTIKHGGKKMKETVVVPKILVLILKAIGRSIPGLIMTNAEMEMKQDETIKTDFSGSAILTFVGGSCKVDFATRRPNGEGGYTPLMFIHMIDIKIQQESQLEATLRMAEIQSKSQKLINWEWKEEGSSGYIMFQTSL